MQIQRFLESKVTLLTVCALFTLALLWSIAESVGGFQSACVAIPVPASVTVAHGASAPPDPWDGIKLAHGASAPPDPWDGIKLAHGASAPPDPWDGFTA